MPVVVSGSAGETVVSGSGLVSVGRDAGTLGLGVPLDKTIMQLTSGSATFNIGNVAGSDFKVINAAATPVLHVEGDDNQVGIGTNAPNQLLTVAGVVSAFDPSLTLDGELWASTGPAQTGAGAGIPAGSTAVRFRSNGHSHISGSEADGLGIGELSPSSKLHVLCSDKTLTLEKTPTGFFNSFGFDGAIPYMTYYSSAGGGMKFGYGESTGNPPAAATTAMFLANDGAVGIGTLSPTAKLNFETTASTIMHISRDGSATAFTSANWALGTIGFGGQDSDSGIDNDAALIEVKTDSAWARESHATYVALSTTATGSVAATERMRINSSGSVGIGTTAPEALFHVHAGDPGVAPHAGAPDFLIENNGTVGMSILGGAANSARIYFGSSGGNRDGKIDYNLNDDKMQFGTADATRMVIDSSGQVGIGVTDPDSTLEVYNAAATDGQQLKLSYDATNFAAFRVDSGGDLHVTSSGGDSTFSVASSLRINRLGDCLLEIDSGFGRNGNRRFQFQSDTAAPNGQLSIGSVSNPDTMIMKGAPGLVGIGGVSGWTPNAILHVSASHTNYGGPILQTDSAGAGVIFSVTGSTTLGAGKVTITGSMETQGATAQSPGGGFNGGTAVPIIRTQKINHEIITTIIVDLAGYQFDNGPGLVIGDDGVASAYILKLTNAVNGLIYKAEMGCIEDPDTGAVQGRVMLVTNPGDLAQGASATTGGITWIDPGADWKAGMWDQSAVRTDNGAAEEDYVYLAIGSTPGGSFAYSVGKLLIKLYGANF